MALYRMSASLGLFLTRHSKNNSVLGPRETRAHRMLFHSAQIPTRYRYQSASRSVAMRCVVYAYLQ